MSSKHRDWEFALHVFLLGLPCHSGKAGVELQEHFVRRVSLPLSLSPSPPLPLFLAHSRLIKCLFGEQCMCVFEFY